jgi:hypothetical protein
MLAHGHVIVKCELLFKIKGGNPLRLHFLLSEHNVFEGHFDKGRFGAVKQEKSCPDR